MVLKDLKTQAHQVSTRITWDTTCVDYTLDRGIAFWSRDSTATVTGADVGTGFDAARQ